VNCPYCRKVIRGWTGFQEVLAFTKHLHACQKNPSNIVLTDGQRTAVTPIKHQGLLEALEIRHASGQ